MYFGRNTRFGYQNIGGSVDTVYKLSVVSKNKYLLKGKKARRFLLRSRNHYSRP